jgi:hypothetical protein
MAKLTLSFKGHHLSIHHLGEAPATIGRDADCGIRIDSLAIAPRHAELVSSGGEYLLLALDPDYPVLLNSEQVDQASLHHGDLIQIGKHTLTYSEDSLELMPPHPPQDAEPEAPEEEEDETAADSMPAYIQVQSGRRIGRVIVLRRSVTRLSRAGAKDVIVARKGDSYHLLRLDEKTSVRIDGIVLADEDVEMELRNGYVIDLDDVRCQFFTGEAGAAPAAEQED